MAEPMQRWSVPGMVVAMLMGLALTTGLIFVFRSRGLDGEMQSRPAEDSPAVGAERNAATVIPAAESPDRSTGRVAVRVQPRAAEVKVGQVIEVDLWLDNRQNQPVDGVELHLRYDPAVLQLVDTFGHEVSAVSKAALHPAWKMVLLNMVDNDAGRVTLALGTGLGGPALASARLPIVTLRFRARAVAAATELSLARLPGQRTEVASRGRSVIGTAKPTTLRVVTAR